MNKAPELTRAWRNLTRTIGIRIPKEVHRIEAHRARMSRLLPPGWKQSSGRRGGV